MLEDFDPKYIQSQGDQTLPVEAGALCIFDGQESVSYITPDLYWEESTGIQYTYDVVNDNPTIDISMWSWCTQVNYYSTEQIQQYLEQMNTFEQHYINEGRNVRFVYMTGNTDRGNYTEKLPAEPADPSNENPAEGYQRHLNNQIIREYCKTHNKTLLDFADIECWLYYANGTAYDFSSYEYDTGEGIVTVPKRHWNYSNIDEAAHTTYENCENKAKAVWWMLARIAGWNGS